MKGAGTLATARDRGEWHSCPVEGGRAHLPQPGVTASATCVLSSLLSHSSPSLEGLNWGCQFVLHLTSPWLSSAPFNKISIQMSEQRMSLRNQVLILCRLRINNLRVTGVC